MYLVGLPVAQSCHALILTHLLTTHNAPSASNIGRMLYHHELTTWAAFLLQALEPFFSVLLSAMFLGDTPTIPIVLSLFPIVGGVAMASVTEATFNWGGFLSAMGSNITFQSRNVLSKKFMGKDTKVKGLPPTKLSSIFTCVENMHLMSSMLAAMFLTCLTSFCS